MSAYNAAPYLREAVDSILAQTFGDFEFIIVNDGSTDETADILASYHDERIRVISQSNRGPGAGRNRALAAVRGEFVAIMDADDISIPERFERELALLEAAPDVDLLTTRTAIVDDRGRPTGKHYPWQFPSALRFRPLAGVPSAYRVEGPLAEGLLQGNFVANPSVMARTRLFRDTGGFDETLRRGQDMELWFRMAQMGCRFAYLDDDLVLYRQHSLNTSLEMRIRSARCSLQLYEKCLKHPGNTPRVRRLIRRALGRRQKDLANLLEQAGELTEARRLYAEAVRNSPEPEQVAAYALNVLRLPNIPITKYFRRRSHMRTDPLAERRPDA